MIMKDSIFYSSIRAFFVALFSVAGITFGFIPILLLLSLFSDTSSYKPTATFTPEIVANAEGKRQILSSSTPVILKINIQGVIGITPLENEKMRTLLVESREGDLKDNRVKAILLHINSPGGSVIDSDGIYREIKAYKERYKVPVYAYVDGLCASGGVYIAMAADKIYASDASIVGSIGVTSTPFLNFSQLMEKLGVRSLTLTAGEDKDMLNPLRPWKPGESDNLQELFNYYYQQFVDIVVTNRPAVSKEKLITEYGAKIFNPKQAQEMGLIDATDYTLGKTIKALAQAIGVEDDSYQVVELQKKTWFSEIFQGTSTLIKGQIVHHINLSPDIDSRLMNQFLYLYRPGCNH